MVSKALVIFIVACTATAVLGAELRPLQKRNGLLSQLLDFTGSLTQSAVDKLISGGHITLDGIQGLINFGANSFMNGASALLRRNVPAKLKSSSNSGRRLGYDTISSMISQAQSDMDVSFKAATQLAKNIRGSLSEHGKDVLDMYLKELNASQAQYKAALLSAASSAADLNSRLDASTLSTDEDLWELIQDNYAVEMADYGTHIKRLGRVIQNNGLDLSP